MLFRSTLISSFLLVSAVLAAPHHHRRQHRSGLLNRIEQSTNVTKESTTSSNWAGAVMSRSSGTFTSVRGHFKAPHVWGDSGTYASAWVGIDGNTCTNAILQTGVAFSPDGNGGGTYQAWYEWYPADEELFDDPISISEGDVIELSVVAKSEKTGYAKITNHNNGQSVSQFISSDHALCMQDAEWIVEDFERGYQPVPFTDFDPVHFTHALADGNHETYRPSDATIFDMVQNGVTLATASVGEDSVTVVRHT